MWPMNILCCPVCTGYTCKFTVNNRIFRKRRPLDSEWNALEESGRSRHNISLMIRRRHLQVEGSLYFMTFIMRIVSLVFLLFLNWQAHAYDVLQLTGNNYAETTAGRTVFIKWETETQFERSCSMFLKLTILFSFEGFLHHGVIIARD